MVDFEPRRSRRTAKQRRLESGSGMSSIHKCPELAVCRDPRVSRACASCRGFELSCWRCWLPGLQSGLAHLDPEPLLDKTAHRLDMEMAFFWHHGKQLA